MVSDREPTWTHLLLPRPGGGQQTERVGPSAPGRARPATRSGPQLVEDTPARAVVVTAPAIAPRPAATRVDVVDPQRDVVGATCHRPKSPLVHATPAPATGRDARRRRRTPRKATSSNTAVPRGIRTRTADASARPRERGPFVGQQASRPGRPRRRARRRPDDGRHHRGAARAPPTAAAEVAALQAELVGSCRPAGGEDEGDRR